MQWIALYYLGKKEFINQKELAVLMQVKESTVARLVDRMEREGLVLRQRKEEDKRAFKLILTDKGLTYRKELLPEGELFNDIISKGISEEEMQSFMMVLKKMRENVVEHKLND